MPINLQGSGNIAEGWGPPPQLHAPELGSLVHAILGNRLARDKMTQESIADTIKNLQQQRESAAYTDALQKAGLLPEGDYGGLGIKGGASLASILQRQKAQQAMEAHRTAMEARIGGRGRGSGGSGETDTQVEAPEDYYGLSVAPGAPSKATTRVINGIVHVQDKHGGWKPGPKWMQQGPAASQTDDPTKTMKQQFGNRFSPEDFNPDTVTIESSKDFNTPSTVTTGTGKKMSLGTFQAGVKAMHGGKQASVGGYDTDAAPPPDSTTTPTQPGAVTGIAPSREEAAVGQSYRAPDGSIRTRTS